MIELMFVGGYTHPAVHVHEASAKGISAVQWDGRLHELRITEVTTSYINPSWVTFDPVRNRLYAVSEVADWNEGLVAAYAIVDTRGRLVFQGITGTGGSSPCHIAVSPDGTLLVVSNYGLAPPTAWTDHVISLIETASLSRVGAFVPQHRPSPNARQERPHGHFAEFSADGSSFTYSDLGEDALFTMRARDLTSPLGVVSLPIGSGPRHFVTDRNTGCRFVVLELDGAVASVAPSGSIQVVKLGGQPSGIRQSVNGRFLYVALRMLNQIAVLEVESGGHIEVIQFASSGGITPRDLCLSAEGDILFVANQDNNCLAALRVDPQNGMLRGTRSELSIGSPSSIALCGVV